VAYTKQAQKATELCVSLDTPARARVPYPYIDVSLIKNGQSKRSRPMQTMFVGHSAATRLLRYRSTKRKSTANYTVSGLVSCSAAKQLTLERKFMAGRQHVACYNGACTVLAAVVCLHPDTVEQCFSLVYRF